MVRDASNKLPAPDQPIDLDQPPFPLTHNVVFSLPGDLDYSPLWAVHIYDRAAFASVHNAKSALEAPLLEPHGPLVNCPIVFQGSK